MKERLLIISDLWGFKNTPWLQEYIRLLSPNFELTFFDSNKNAQIPSTLTSQLDIHQYFTQKKGLEHSVVQLQKQGNQKTSILAFSIGGTIAWKAIQKGFKFNTFIAVSSTRLRLEKKRPSGNIKLFFGTEDKYAPTNAWFTKNNISYTLIKDKKHNLYTIQDSIQTICSSLINETNY